MRTSTSAAQRGPVDLISNRPKPKIIQEVDAEGFHGIRAALGFDVVFEEEFKILRPYLGRISRQWPMKIQDMILDEPAMSKKISSREVVELDALMKRYIRQMLSGRFYEEFFEVTEELGSFLAKRDVPNSWLVGAFMNVFYDAQLELFFDKEARQGRIVVSALRCLLKIMTLTIQILNQASFRQMEKRAVARGG